MQPTNFRTAVAATVRELGLNEVNWKAEGWKNLWSQVNQEVLNDAFNQHGSIRLIFSGLGQIDARNCKNIVRVQKKMTEQPSGRENYFKVVSDFDAVRIPCDVTEIPEKIDRIKDIVLEQGGQMYIREEPLTSALMASLCRQIRNTQILLSMFMYFWTKSASLLNFKLDMNLLLIHLRLTQH